MTEQLTPHRTDSPRPRVSFAELPTVYPTTSLLLAIFLTAGGLLLAWTAVRIGWGFDAEHQLLANRGYAVLSVNFRGSTGLGK